MGIVAIDPQTGARCELLRNDNHRVKFPEEVLARLVSPISGTPVIGISSAVRYAPTSGQPYSVRSHWRLRSISPWPKGVEFDDEYGGYDGDSPVERSESREHLEGKHRVSEYLRQMHPRCQVFIEHRIAIPQRNTCRIGDICLFDFDAAGRVALAEVHEIQFSPITPELLRQRIDDHESQGYSSVWWLGPRARQSLGVRDVLSELCTEFYEIDFAAREDRRVVIEPHQALPATNAQGCASVAI
jgi:hypothetical protein